MADSSSDVTVETVQVRITQERFPPYHELHGTPNPVVRRQFVFELRGGTARWEQSDYGHPGRFNPPEPRSIAASLQPRLHQMCAAIEALAALLD